MSNSEWHRELMRGYYAARDAAELERDVMTRGYDTELREYDKPMITFKEYLKGMRRDT